MLPALIPPADSNASRFHFYVRRTHPARRHRSRACSLDCRSTTRKQLQYAASKSAGERDCFHWSPGNLARDYRRRRQTRDLRYLHERQSMLSVDRNDMTALSVDRRTGSAQAPGTLMRSADASATHCLGHRRGEDCRTPSRFRSRISSRPISISIATCAAATASRVVYESVLSISGELVRTGRVLAAEFVNQRQGIPVGLVSRTPTERRRLLHARGQESPEAFLRSPLEFSRITSGFTTARFHPVSAEWRAHRGIDYGAPAGARVKATGDGWWNSRGARAATAISWHCVIKQNIRPGTDICRRCQGSGSRQPRVSGRADRFRRRDGSCHGPAFALRVPHQRRAREPAARGNAGGTGHHVRAKTAI